MSLRRLEVHGLPTITRVATRLSKDAGRAWRREILQAVRPIRDDARARFRSMGGQGPRVAPLVGVYSTSRGVGLRLKDTRYLENGVPSFGVEFGAKRGATRRYRWANQFNKGIMFYGAKRIPYNSPRMFGTWTGNQFRPEFFESGRSTSGRAFYPAIAEGRNDVLRDLDRLVQNYVRILAQAGSNEGG